MEQQINRFTLTGEAIAAAANEWMRRYIEEPAAFEAEFKTVTDFVAQSSNGVTPSYGAESAEYLWRIHCELQEAAKSTAA